MLFPFLIAIIDFPYIPVFLFKKRLFLRWFCINRSEKSIITMAHMLVSVSIKKKKRWLETDLTTSYYSYFYLYQLLFFSFTNMIFVSVYSFNCCAIRCVLNLSFHSVYILLYCFFERMSAILSTKYQHIAKTILKVKWHLKYYELMVLNL